MNIVWMRGHYRVTGQSPALKLDRLSRSDQTLFREARRIVIAEMQHITYADRLLNLLSNMSALDTQFSHLLPIKCWDFSAHDLSH